VEPFVPVRPAAAPRPDPPPLPSAQGDGPLGALTPWAAEDVTDLLLDGTGALWLDRGRGLVAAHGWRPLDPAAARRLAVGLVARGGRHLDDASPCVDVRLATGVRVHAVLPPVTTRGPVVSVRVGRRRPWRLADLVAAGAVPDPVADRLLEAMRERRNVLVCGPAGSGKTALLAALLAEAPHAERIVTIEDVAELDIDHPHVVGLETRQPNSDGAGAIGLPQLVREALRMRPDRLVLGECRGAEVADLLAALNTGHDGGAGTVHSTSLDDVAARLEALGALAGLSPEALCRQVLSAIDLVVHLGRRDGVRRVERLGAFTEDGRGRLALLEVA
jgi:pilus assembly protein CpaF